MYQRRSPPGPLNRKRIRISNTNSSKSLLPRTTSQQSRQDSVGGRSESQSGTTAHNTPAMPLTKGVPGSIISPPPIVSDIVPRLEGLPRSSFLTDSARAARSQAVSVLQDMALDRTLYESKKSRPSKQSNAAPRARRAVEHFSQEKELQAESGRDISSDWVLDNDKDEDGLLKVTSPPTVSDPQPLEIAPSGRPYRQWRGDVQS